LAIQSHDRGFLIAWRQVAIGFTVYKIQMIEAMSLAAS